ncbi:MAG: ATP-binding protein [Chloroflexota bacterium]
MARRLILSFIFIVIATVLAMIWATINTINVTFNNFKDDHLDAHLHHMPNELLSYYEKNNSWVGIDETLDNLSRSLNMDMALVDTHRDIVIATSNDIQSIAQSQNSDGADLVIPLQDKTFGVVVGVAYFKSSSLLRQHDKEFLRRLSISALGVGLSIALLASVISYGIARSFSQPVVHLSKAAETVARGNYNIQIEVTRQDEIGLLGQAFNQMTSKIGNLEKMRRNLVINVSHDLRTPLTVVRGYLEGLRSGQIRDRRSAEHAFELMHSEVQNLITLIDSLNEVAALDSGDIPLKRTPVSVDYLVNQAVERIQPSAGEKSIDIDIVPTSNNSSQESYPVKLDLEKMGQVLYNLLDNAIHYSAIGGVIKISGAVHDNDIIFIVEDNGDGVPVEHQPFIFERFYRADQARNRRRRGYGMGLSIVRSIVHAHGGQVDLSSNGIPGQPTRFTITIPNSANV